MDYGDNNSNKKSSCRLVGTYMEIKTNYMCAVEVDNNSFLTGSSDCTLRLWNKTTCECLRFAACSYVYCMIRLKDNLRVVCGLHSGIVEIRRIDDLEVISSFRLHTGPVKCICELEDGSFVSGSSDVTIKQWDENGRLLQTVSGIHTSAIMSLIELKSGIIVALSLGSTVAIWKVSTGQLIQRFTIISTLLSKLVRLSDDKFATGSWDNTIRVWSAKKGECIETISTDYEINAMTRLGGFVVTASGGLMEVRRLKYDM